MVANTSALDPCSTGGFAGMAICGRSPNLLASGTLDMQFSSIDAKAQVLYQ
jgi:hypothetical protein